MSPAAICTRIRFSGSFKDCASFDYLFQQSIGLALQLRLFFLLLLRVGRRLRGCRCLVRVLRKRNRGDGQNESRSDCEKDHLLD